MAQVTPPVVQNIVCTASLGTTLYLPSIVRRLPCAEYNAKRFAAVTTRLVSPKTTALFFGSGKVVCTGARTHNAARLAMLKYVNMVRLLGFRVGLYNFEIQNIVASAAMGQALDLPAILSEHSLTSSYEPELFPGLVFRPAHTSTVFLIFRSGRIVITGSKSMPLIERDFEWMKPILRSGVVDGPQATLKRPENAREWDLTNSLFREVLCPTPVVR